jgi:hypothetical protein
MSKEVVEVIVIVVEEILGESCREEDESCKNLCKYFLNEYNRGELLSDICTCFLIFELTG